MRRALLESAASVLIALGVAVACVHVPAVGDVCRVGDGHCLDFHTSLSCQAGALKLFSCPGPKGCQIDSNRRVACDQSQNVAPGEACFPEYDGLGQCLPDAGSFLRCAHGAWVRLDCPGVTKCQTDGGDLTCR